VFSDIDDELDDAVSKLKKELLEMATSQGLTDVTEVSLEGPCQALRTRLKTQFHKNLDKFELYSFRNIFVIPQSEPEGPARSSDLEATTSDLNMLRDQYMARRMQLTQLSRDVLESESLVNEMKTALFNLRVGAQVLDVHQIEPLMDTAASLAHNKAELSHLISKADAFCSESGSNKGVIEESDGGVDNAFSIESGDAEQLQRLSSRMK
jgi:ribosomal protein L29